MADPTTCPHGVTLGQRCFACNSADTLPLTPVPCVHRWIEIGGAVNEHTYTVDTRCSKCGEERSIETPRDRGEVATLLLLAKLRAHPGFGQLLSSIEDAALRCARSAMSGGVGGYSAEECSQRAEVYTLLLELLGGPHG